jgi:AraC family transcriptional regulator, ethanolamine operon transcriptional activator
MFCLWYINLQRRNFDRYSAARVREDHMAQAFLRCSFSEPSELALGLHSLEAAALPMFCAPFSGFLSVVSLDDITVEIVRGTPLLLFETVPARRLGFKLMLDGSAGASWDGRPVGGSEVALFGGSERHAAAYREAFACAFVSFPAGSGAVQALPDDPGPRRGASPPIRLADMRAHARMVAILHAAERDAAAVPDADCTEEAQRALHAEIFEAARQLLASPAATTHPFLQSVSARQRIMRRANAYLFADPARPVYTEELCAALGVSQSALREAFDATYGISPHRFLKLRRMCMVRATLFSGSGRWRSVKAAALSHGFWDLGQFAHDYRAVFGEAPSETLARAVR